MKFEHAMSVKSSDHTSLFHLGRLNLLLGEVPVAETCLKQAASIKPTHSETLFCLGMCLSNKPDLSKPLLLHGLDMYLRIRQNIAEGIKASITDTLHGNDFWRPTNTLIVRHNIGTYNHVSILQCRAKGS